MVSDAVALASAPFRIQFDRERLRLVRIEKGPFMEGADASDIIFSRSIRQSNGLAAVNIARYQGAGGADGQGELVTVTFEGVAAGAAQVRVIPTSPRDAEGSAVRIPPLEAQITVE